VATVPAWLLLLMVRLPKRVVSTSVQSSPGVLASPSRHSE
jgi:hypothetical protein